MTKLPPLKVEDHNVLFKSDEFKDMMLRKRAYENPPTDEEIAAQIEYSKTAEYKEKNFDRKHLVINPVKACQPLGAIYASSGFEGCLPYVHGSQGCAAYFRSHLNRHFKEPFAAVSDSMTEDAAVFGGHKNMDVGLQNAYEVYKPKMLAMCTTCMAEVIGDDLNAFIENAKNDGRIPKEFPVPFAHTPSFVGSHVTGYDNMLRGILNYFTLDVENTESDNGSINIIPGFDPFCVGNIPELKRILYLMEVDYTILADNSLTLNTPLDGEYKLSAGLTTIDDVVKAKNAKATFSLMPDCTQKVTKNMIEGDWSQDYYASTPMGLTATDEWLMKISEITGKPIPDELEVERGQAIDAIADSNYYLHGKRFSIFGDASFVEALTAFYMEMGAEPVHIVVTPGKKKWGKKYQERLKENEFGQEATVHYGKDLWHLRSLLYEDKTDFIVGNTYGKLLSKELDIPLIRIGFPIFDRHHLHRYPTLGYKGIVNLVSWSVNTLLDDLDAKAQDFNNDIVR